MTLIPFFVPRREADFPTVFPTVEATNVSEQATASTTHTVALPASIAAGDLLLILFAVNQGATVTTPTDWTSLFNTASGIRLVVFYKVASGSEGASVAITTDLSRVSAHNTYRISGYQGSPEAATAATGSSANPDPPSLSPSWGSAKTLWIAVNGLSAAADSTAAPTDYTDLLTISEAHIGGAASIGSARRELEAASDDPATFTTGSSANWVATTIAVRPA